MITREGSAISTYPCWPGEATVTLSFSRSTMERMAVELRLYDILGSDMGTIVSGIQDAGEHSVVWNAGNYASGTYFYTMKAGSFEETKRLVLLK